MKNYPQFKNKLLQDKKIKKAYNKLGPEFDFISIFIKKRIEKGLSQEELAKRVGTRQSAISRLESGRYNPSLKILRKVAQVLDAEVKITLI